MAIDLAPLPLPPTADASKFRHFGTEIKGVNPGSLTPDEFAAIREVYKVSCIWFILS